MSDKRLTVLRIDSDAPRFGIWCEVSGGVTGYRGAWLKSGGELAVFADRAAADAEAAHYNASQNASPYRTANFSYTVKQF